MIEKLTDLLTHFSVFLKAVNPVIVITKPWISAVEIIAVFASYLGLRLTLNKRRQSDRFRLRRSGPKEIFKKTAKVAGGVATAVGLTSLFAMQSPTDETEVVEEEENELPKHQLGDIPFQASILGSGGVYIAQGTEAQGIAILQTEFELGINYFDTATQYGDGESERRHGVWLQGLEAQGLRDKVFIATKTLSRGYIQAKEEIENSFARLRIEHIDLLQVHAVNNLDIWGQVSGMNGALKAVEDAKASGRVKHIGISNHNDPAALLKILEEYPFESVLVPIGVADSLIKPFEEDVIPYCMAKGISVVAMKIFAEGKLTQTEADLEKCFHYTLSMLPSTAIVGMATPAQVIQNVAWVRTFVPMTGDQKAELVENVRGLIDISTLWWKQ